MNNVVDSWLVESELRRKALFAEHVQTEELALVGNVVASDERLGNLAALDQPCQSH